MVRPCALPYVLPAVLLAGCAHAAVAPQPLQMAYYQPSGNMSDAPAALTGTPIAETPSVLTPGKVLLVRTQEAAPQATAEELKAAMLQQATVAAQTEARHIAIQTSTQLAQKFEQLATRTDALLNQTSAVLAANTTTQQAVTAQLNASSQLGESVKQTTTAQLAQLATTTQQKITELEQSSLKPADVQSIATTVATQTAAVTANKTATEVATQVAVASGTFSDATGNKNTDGSDPDNTIKFSLERVYTVTENSDVNIKLPPGTTVDTASFSFFNASQQLIKEIPWYLFVATDGTLATNFGNYFGTLSAQTTAGPIKVTVTPQ
ncbi:MAG: hypothetical protein EBR79_04385, partial [Proteobacteria bacterium]|nr:hypothetical protein [Pseudomonadota bacterium]